MCINLVLADPYPVMLEGLTHVFENTPDFAVKACVTNGDAAMKALLEHEPHILVMDLSLTQRSGLALLQALQLAGGLVDRQDAQGQWVHHPHGFEHAFDQGRPGDGFHALLAATSGSTARSKK